MISCHHANLHGGEPGHLEQSYGDQNVGETDGEPESSGERIKEGKQSWGEFFRSFVENRNPWR